MASSRAFLLAALCSLVILSTFIGSAQSGSCCLRYVTRHHMPCRRLLGYTMQNITASCDINAVIFHLRGKFLCADPDATWTQRGMKCLDERKKRRAQILNRGN